MTLVFPHARPLSRPRGRPLVMGIVNVTPDSFSGDGRVDPDAAVRHGLAQLAAGADLLDLGGLSTRPGAAEADEGEEARRLVPVVAALRRRTDAPLSVDTYRPAVAAACLDAGADIINDVTALSGGWAADGGLPPDFADPAPMALLCAGAGAHLILMHAVGSPARGWTGADYPEGVVEAVRGFLRERGRRARLAGVPVERLWFDPGFGFGKSSADQEKLLRRLRAFDPVAPDDGDDNDDGNGDGFLRILVGLSRKRWIGELTGLPVADRDAASVDMALLAAARGAGMVRVHAVSAHPPRPRFAPT